eukprot:2171221-Rhodomonas_salina.4
MRALGFVARKRETERDRKTERQGDSERLRELSIQASSRQYFRVRIADALSKLVPPDAMSVPGMARASDDRFRTLSSSMTDAAATLVPTPKDSTCRSSVAASWQSMAARTWERDPRCHRLT